MLFFSSGPVSLSPVNYRMQTTNPDGTPTRAFHRVTDEVFNRLGGYDDFIWLNAAANASATAQINDLQQRVNDLESLVGQSQAETAVLRGDARFSLAEDAERLAQIAITQAFGAAGDDLRPLVEELAIAVVGLLVTQAQTRTQVQILEAQAQDDQAQFFFQVGQSQAINSDTSQIQQQVAAVQDDVSGLTTDDIPEGGTNFYFSDGLARAALSGTGAIAYDNTTGVIDLPTQTGWAADTGTDSRASHATYSGTASAGYVQAELQGVMDAVTDATETIKALKDDLLTALILGA